MLINLFQNSVSSFDNIVDPDHLASGSEVIKLFPCSTQLSTKFILLINVKMPTIVGILTFISRIIYKTSESSKARKSLIFSILVFIKSCNFVHS